MDTLVLAAWSFPVLLLLIFLRIPIGLSMLALGLCGSWLAYGSLGPLLNQMKTIAYSQFSSHSLSIVPLFLLMGQFASLGGMSQALFKAGEAFLGHRKGGIAMAAIGACAGFGSICGSSLATAATMGQVALPELRRAGYSGALSTGALAAGGTLGILIPPSIVLVIYAILTEQNIAKLFAAAMVPGLIAMGGYMIAIAVYVRLVPGQAPEHDVVNERLTLQSLAGILPIGLIFLLVFGGIYGGLFTPTEGAAVGTASTFVAALLKRELTLAKLKYCFYATAESSAMIFMIFIGADMMNAALALTQVPDQLASLVTSWGLSPLMVVSAILLLYVVLGAVMDELSMILLTIPIFFPLVMGLDFGLPSESVAIWFGIMVLMTVGFGLLAPPVGLNVYVVNGMAKDVPIAESYRGVLPFLASDVLRTLLLLFFPAASLWLVQFVG